jgi:uncharacterized protein YhfF
MSDAGLFELGEPGPLREQLIQAVLTGQKTATSALLAQYEADHEPLPRIGEERVMIDSTGQAVGRVVLTKVSVIALGEVDDRLAHDEGEGFRDAGDWRAAHESFWRTYVLPELPGQHTLADDTQVVIERFRLVADLP